jgi:hypothetical protein
MQSDWLLSQLLPTASHNAGVNANSSPNMTAVTDALDDATFLQSQQDNSR